jgi:hypothetical protein
VIPVMLLMSLSSVSLYLWLEPQSMMIVKISCGH